MRPPAELPQESRPLLTRLSRPAGHLTGAEWCRCQKHRLSRTLPRIGVFVLLVFGLVGLLSTTSLAQDAEPGAAQPAPAEAPAVAALPPYFTGTSPDPKAPLWPDPTGAKAGYWTTPAAGPVGDGDPAAQTIPGLYDRVTHNLFSINMVWTLIAGFLVMFM